jgi:hypothetical protein
MTAEMIEKFLDSKVDDAMVQIHFKDRDTVRGVFIHSVDYDELKTKNFWRIVSNQHVEQWKKSKNDSLARLYNGASFTRLTEEQ